MTRLRGSQWLWQHRRMPRCYSYAAATSIIYERVLRTWTATRNFPIAGCWVALFSCQDESEEGSRFLSLAVSCCHCYVAVAATVGHPAIQQQVIFSLPSPPSPVAGACPRALAGGRLQKTVADGNRNLLTFFLRVWVLYIHSSKIHSTSISLSELLCILPVRAGFQSWHFAQQPGRLL